MADLATAYYVYAKQQKIIDDARFKRKQEELLADERKTWLISGTVGKSDCLTLWGAALEISFLVGHEREGVEEAAREDAYDVRLPQLQSAIASGMLRAINADTLLAGRDVGRHSDLVMSRDFNKWLEYEYSHLMGEKKSLKLSSKERQTMIILIRKMQRLREVDDRESLAGIDMITCLKDLILGHYGGALPDHKKFKIDMQKAGYTNISSTTITKYFNKLDA